MTKAAAGSPTLAPGSRMTTREPIGTPTRPARAGEEAMEMVSGLPVFQVDWSLELVQSVAACWVMMVDWAVTASPVPRARTMISGWVG